MSRKLASIQKIEWINPIPNKDKIELAGVLGFQVIVQKNEYKIGDKTIFVEIDSVLPDKPEFEFLKSKKFRIKTMKLSGTLSQGICFPLSMLPNKEYELDEDVTQILEIQKYEPNEDNRDIELDKIDSNKYKHPIFKILFRFKFIRNLILSKKQNKGFPEFISKTDETRIQNIPHILKNKDIKYVVHEKIDGQSGTFFLKKTTRKWFWQKDSYDFGVCSRNLRLWNKNNSSYWSVVEKYNIENILKDLIRDRDFIAIQGECVASNVQGNKYKVEEPDLYVFNLIYPEGKVDSLKGERILREYGLKWCPLIDDSFTLLDSVNEMLEYATGESELYKTLREGLVFRSSAHNISFKSVSPTFLIKHDE